MSTERVGPVLVLAPMRSELRPLVRLLGATRAEAPGLVAYRAARAGGEVVVAQLGVGPAVAAKTTARLLDRFGAARVVVSGIAGGLAPECRIGVLVVPEVVLDVSSGRAYRPDPLGAVAPEGVLGTTADLVTDPVSLERLADRGVRALDMESSAVAAVCVERGVPWSVFRVISDRPDGGLTDQSLMGVLRPDGSTDGRAAARLLATRPWRIPGLARLGRDATAAARAAADAALAALA